VELRVADRGAGIAPEALPHVFDLFAQSGDVRSRSRAGLGIGLHVARNIVESHGGTVVARSDGLGAGSEFVVSLPLASPLP
jgi:signal transduction histidine kinase